MTPEWKFKKANNGLSLVWVRYLEKWLLSKIFKLNLIIIAELFIKPLELLGFKHACKNFWKFSGDFSLKYIKWSYINGHPGFCNPFVLGTSEEKPSRCQILASNLKVFLLAIIEYQVNIKFPCKELL